MGIYKIYPSKDTTLYSEFPSMNTGIDEILEASTYVKDDKGQTAYDYMLERKQHQTFTHRGKTYKLQQYIEALIADKNSELYRMPDGVVAGKDYQQSFILRIIHAAEKGAYADMWNKYPILAETLEERGVFIQEKFDAVGNASSYDSILETIINK